MKTLPPLSKKVLLSIGAGFVSLLLVVGTFYFSGDTFKTSVAEALSSEEALAAYAQKDTDGDQLPDWQEALYGGDPEKASSLIEGMADGEAVKSGKVAPKIKSDEPEGEAVYIPGKAVGDTTLTARFARSFFTRLARLSTDEPLTQEAKDQLMSDLMEEYAQETTKLLASPYTRSVIKVDTSIEAQSYLVATERALLRGSHAFVGTNADPLVLMYALVVDNDETARPKLLSLSREYKAVALRLIQVHVPKGFETSHLELIRAFDTLGTVTALVASYEKDPIALFGALRLLVPASLDIAKSITAIVAGTLATYTPEEGEEGYTLYRVYLFETQP